MFARVLGPFLAVVAVTAAARAADLREVVAEFEPNSPWTWVAGAFTLLTGLVVVAFHQSWRSAAAIIVSVTGWLTTLKGLFLLSFPSAYLSFGSTALDGLNTTAWLRALYVIFALLGLYLTYVGWAPTRSRQP